jgi:Icc-related predicted phosphoesterase
MRVLAFSDLHCDQAQARRLVERAKDADLVLCLGDLANVHRGLEEMVSILRAMQRPTLLVPGNNETDQELQEACRAWPEARVLHGASATVSGRVFFGLGGGIPVTPWAWSFDLTEEDALRRLADCPEGCILLVHSPPKGHVDQSGPRHFGSQAILETIEKKRPVLVLCGHIHESWGKESWIGSTRILNLGPSGTWLDIP